jgi:hypothetical protein
MRGDQQQVQDLNGYYQNYLIQEQQILQILANDLQIQNWQIEELEEKLANIDYSNLQDLLESPVADLAHVCRRGDREFKQTILGGNMAKLYQIARDEKNEKICHWLKKYAPLF